MPSVGCGQAHGRRLFTEGQCDGRFNRIAHWLLLSEQGSSEQGCSVAHKWDRGRWKAAFNQYVGLVGLLLGAIGLSDAPAQDKYRLVWPLLIVLAGIALVIDALFVPFKKRPQLLRDSAICHQR
jgi:hypothetical protein